MSCNREIGWNHCNLKHIAHIFSTVMCLCMFWLPVLLMTRSYFTLSLPCWEGPKVSFKLWPGLVLISSVVALPNIVVVMSSSSPYRCLVDAHLWVQHGKHSALCVAQENKQYLIPTQTGSISSVLRHECIFSFVCSGIWFVIILLTQLMLQEFVFSVLFLNITYNQSAIKHFYFPLTDVIQTFFLSVRIRSVPVSK